MFSDRLYRLANAFYAIVGTGKKLEETDTVLILGGSNGLGRELCISLYNRKIRVINVDTINFLPLHKYYSFIHCHDFADTSNVQNAMQDVKSLEFTITALINNVQRDFETIYDEEDEKNTDDDSVDKMRECVSSNLTNVVIATKYFLKEIVPQTIRLSKGKLQEYYIVNLSTLLTLHVPERASRYISSKAALNQFHDSLTSECRCSARRAKIKTLLVFLPYVKDLESWKYLRPYLSEQLVQCMQDGRQGDVLLRIDNTPLTACKISDAATCRLSNMLPKWKQ
ncbi:related to Oxidoreductase-like protein SRL4 [Zygosaccharomyces bailii ISA1307]|nr:related to Oxidoreductase-like protein SRL4 [Zygosaccharomyces bailii ISA1307]